MAGDEDIRQAAITLLEEGKQLPPHYKDALFPSEKREYELTYADKTREEDVLAETMAVPLQAIRSFGNGNDWENKVIFGDNLQALRRLLELKREGKITNADGTEGIRLVYIDPPFATKREFQGEDRAYSDKVIGAEFVEFLRQRLILLRELMATNGSIYVHLDEKKSHYIKVILDEVFGEENFQREVIWRIGWVSGFKTQAQNWIRNHDVILYYTKTRDAIFNKEYIPYPEGYTRRDGKPPTGEGYPIEDTWNCYEVDQLHSIQIVSFSGEKTGFPTQKNEDLLARIIRSATNEGDLVLDAFAGSGTTLAVADKLGRRWIGIDSAKLAIYTIQRRMLNLRKEIRNTGPSIQHSPYTVYNAGLYDFHQLSDLGWSEWRAFALTLFECKDDPHKVKGVEFDGYRRDSDALVFDHRAGGGAVLDHGFIDELYDQMGSSTSTQVYIIAPAASVAFLEDYVDKEDVRYYILRIPYSIINELHRKPFDTFLQPRSESDINATMESVGFDFMQRPNIELSFSVTSQEGDVTQAATITVDRFESRSLVGDEREGSNALSIVLVDYDYPQSDARNDDFEIPPFEVDDFFFAKDITDEDGQIQVALPLDKFGEHFATIWIDVYGNELTQVHPASVFGEPIDASEPQ